MAAILLSHAGADEAQALAGIRGVDVYRLGPVDALVDEACRRLPRNLRPDEWPLDGAPPVTCPDL